ncbi:transcription termination factor MTERF2, chloroplastic [Cajanus cajan]|uniref:transcription termination factor MTERF2, chloroplastic n=1 Tax=Cajanus cajan TaxID=3821 RepID=UPI00098D8A1E|nr:transcription termination factor MTERF2, chloroplastic [Cajanus cajan]
MVPNFLIARLIASSLTRYKSTHFLLGSHSLLQHKHNASLFLFNSYTSGAIHPKGDTFTVSYLVNSCGVSPTLAKELSKRVNLKTPDGPNAVIDLLSNYGFSKTQIAKLVEKHPLVLVAKAENTLLPKLKFLRSIGVSNTDLPKILLRNHVILMCSLENFLIPRYEILRGIVQDDQKVVRILKSAAYNITYADVLKTLVPNINVLRQSSVPQASISLLMVYFSNTAHMKHSKFLEALKTARGIGFDPSKTNLIHALVVLLNTNKTMQDSKFKVYERWGWNHKLALQAFRKFPVFMMLSKETYSKKMSFLVNDMGLPSEDIAEYAQVLAYSLEKRIIPRFSVIKILQSKGLLKKDLHFSTFMCMNEQNFLMKFMINFQNDLPLLSDVYNGLINQSSK